MTKILSVLMFTLIAAIVYIWIIAANDVLWWQWPLLAIFVMWTGRDAIRMWKLGQRSDIVKELHVRYGQILEIQEFRLFCLENGIEDGVIYEDGVPFYLNEYSVFKDRKYPKSMDDEGKITSKILKLALDKRKRFRDNGNV